MSKQRTQAGKKVFESNDRWIIPRRDYDGSMATHDIYKSVLGMPGVLFRELLIEWGKVAFEPSSLEDSAGRQKVDRLSVNEMVKMCEAATVQFMEVCEARGWLDEVPTPGELFKAAEHNAKRNS